MRLNTFILLVSIVSNNVYANHSPIAASHSDRQYPILIENDLTKTLNNNKILSCSADVSKHEQMELIQNRDSHINKPLAVSLVYLNEPVKAAYNTMRNGVIRYVSTEVALSLFNFSINGFSAESIASYVSAGTKQFLPFEFANGVKITDATPKGGIVVYRAEMPVTEDHQQSLPLVIAGRVSTITTVLNDKEIVDDLLGRNVVIQYDYYDSKGVFFCSFTISKTQTLNLYKLT